MASGWLAFLERSSYLYLPIKVWQLQMAGKLMVVETDFHAFEIYIVNTVSSVFSLSQRTGKENACVCPGFFSVFHSFLSG